MAKKTPKLSADELKNRIKMRIYFPDTVTRYYLCGEEPKVAVDKPGYKYVDVASSEVYRKFVSDLHTDWIVSEDFVDMSGLEEAE